ncbi:MAG: hypothetical protein S0880_04925 [Actinomycetota bacterium]|nr:hypothetical protein [Actinomycetota bacterium]
MRQVLALGCLMAIAGSLFEVYLRYDQLASANDVARALAHGALFGFLLGPFLYAFELLWRTISERPGR